MINDLRLAKREEKSLDEWVDGVISEITDIAYTVMLEINLALDEAANYVR